MTIHLIYDGVHLQHAYYNRYLKALEIDTLYEITEIIVDRCRNKAAMPSLTGVVCTFVTGTLPEESSISSEQRGGYKWIQERALKKQRRRNEYPYEIQFPHSELIDEYDMNSFKQNESECDGAIISAIEAVPVGDYVILVSIDGDTINGEDRAIYKSFAVAAETRTALQIRFEDAKQGPTGPNLAAVICEHWTASWNGFPTTKFAITELV